MADNKKSIEGLDTLLVAYELEELKLHTELVGLKQAGPNVTRCLEKLEATQKVISQLGYQRELLLAQKKQ